MIKDSDGKVSFYGVYRGVVADTRDPLSKNRIRVKVPQVLDTQITEWCWPINTSGVSLPTPAIGQGVWVMFEGGNPSFPIWAGPFGKISGTGLPIVVTKSPSISGLLVSGTGSDGVSGLDLVATLVNMSETISELESQISALEGRVAALE
jgi:hypothetical protein